MSSLLPLPRRLQDIPWFAMVVVYISFQLLLHRKQTNVAGEQDNRKSFVLFKHDFGTTTSLHLEHYNCHPAYNVEGLDTGSAFALGI